MDKRKLSTQNIEDRFLNIIIFRYTGFPYGTQNKGRQAPLPVLSSVWSNPEIYAQMLKVILGSVTLLSNAVYRSHREVVA